MYFSKNNFCTYALLLALFRELRRTVGLNYVRKHFDCSLTIQNFTEIKSSGWRHEIDQIFNHGFIDHDSRNIFIINIF